MKIAKQSIDLGYKGTKKHLNLRTALISLCMFAFVGTSAQTGTVTVKLQNASVKELFSAIEKQTSYRFSYRDAEIKGKGNVTISATNRELKQLLKGELSKLGLKYAVTGNKIIVTPVAAAASVQPKKVTGKVVDANGEPVIGATIKEQGTANGTITDFDGNFTLDVADNAMLEVSYIGYKSQELQAVAGKMLSVTLREDAEALDEVVVIGYGTTKKSDLIASVSSIKGEVIRSTASTSINDALQGKIPGLDIVSSRYEGDNRDVYIRGSRSLKAGNTPLVIIDGVPGDMYNINMNDVASVEVLKDAASAAIYGSQGANGVIIITTKRGNSSGKTTVNYDAFYGIDIPHFMDMMPAEKFLQLKRDVYKLENNCWGENIPDEKIFTNDQLEMIANNEFYDWQDIIFRNGSTMKHNISISSGNEKTKFSISGAYEHNQGYNQNSEARKYFLTSTVDHKLTKWMDLGATIRFRQRRSSGFSEYGQALFYGTPLCRPYDENGDVITYPNPDEGSVSVLGDFIDGQYKNDTDNMNFNSVFNVTIRPIKHLTYRSNLGYTYNSTKDSYFYGSQSFQVNGGVNRAGREHEADNRITWNNTLTYDNYFGKHHVIADAIQEIIKYQIDDTSAEGRSMDVEDMTYYNLGILTENIGIKSSYSGYQLASFMGRIRYSYADKYLFNFSVRSDGSSRLAEGNKWATFYSAGAAWRVSEEEFLKDIKWLSNLKLRYAYGMVGNQAIDSYVTLGQLDSYPYQFGSAGTGFYGYRPSALANKDLGWEITRTHNIGIDFGFFQNKLSGSVEYYHTTTDDLLMDRAIPVTTGFSMITQNIGKTQNTGVEVSLNANILRRKDFSFNMFFNFAVNNNKIVDLINGEDDITNNWFIGHPINVFYNYEKIGIWQLGEEEEAALYGKQPGDIKMKDQNPEDGKQITADADKVILGNKDPKYIASLGGNLQWKGLDVSFTLNSRWDYLVDASGYGSFVIPTGTRWLADVDYWTPDNPTNLYPRPSALWPANVELCGIMKGDYIKLQDLTVGYDFTRLIKKYIPVSRLRVYAQLRNAFYLYRAARENIIPESPGIELTVPRSINFGINLSF